MTRRFLLRSLAMGMVAAGALLVSHRAAPAADATPAPAGNAFLTPATVSSASLYARRGFGGYRAFGGSFGIGYRGYGRGYYGYSFYRPRYYGYGFGLGYSYYQPRYYGFGLGYSNWPYYSYGAGYGYPYYSYGLGYGNGYPYYGGGYPYYGYTYYGPRVWGLSVGVGNYGYWGYPATGGVVYSAPYYGGYGFGVAPY